MPNAGNRSRDMALVALFAALTAVGAFIRIPVPVVPFTLQFLFTNLAGLLLGAKRGAAAACVYMAAGLLGIPVFTQGGGPWYVMNPTFGYIAGFAAGAWLAGFIVQRCQKKSFALLLAASFADIAVVYLFGVVYYWFARVVLRRLARRRFSAPALRRRARRARRPLRYALSLRRSRRKFSRESEAENYDEC